MSINTAKALWDGTLKQGHGKFELGSKLWSAPYTFKSRFEGAQGTNPEELIAAAHASCFSMALSGGLEHAGFPSESIETIATVKLDALSGGGFAITEILLDVKASVPGITEKQFAEIAEATKVNCPVSKALASVKITLTSFLL
jgi:lipoyl-dependent peroxiredoxin